jgi:diguanylate cyclase (GGDEF)-like protein
MLNLMDSAADRAKHRPGTPAVARDAFTLLLTSGCLLAGVTHVAFCVLFYQAGVQAMAQVNVASVLLYVLAAMLLKQERVGLALTLIGLEVVGHAVLAVRVVGWDSGFHYYLLITIPILLASQVSKWPFKISVGVLIALAYLLMDTYWRKAVPLRSMDADTLAHLHRFNLVSTMALLGGLTVLYVRLITQAEQRLHQLATTDSLTGLMNRRSLIDALDREQARRQRKPHPMAVILVDIDHFKKLNDTWGHTMGDWALQAVANILKQGVREMDYVARWGGEEFLIILPFASAHDAHPVAERLRQAIAGLRFPGKDHALRVTVTLGLTEMVEEEPTDQAIQRADLALYQGKHEGRDRVVLNQAA